MFIFPKDEREQDRISIEKDSITLKSYGLPMIFWGYLAAVLTVIFAMTLAIKGPLYKLYQMDDNLNKILAVSVVFTIVAIVGFLLCFFFYEKFIIKEGLKIKVIHRIFWTPIIKRDYTLKSNEDFSIKHYLDSPNVAKIRGESSLKGFENRGYFQLFFTDSNEKEVLLDRSNQKRSLVQMKELLTKF